MVEITQLDLDTLYQAHKELFVRLDLYERTPDSNGVSEFRKMDEISGVVISGSAQEDAESDVRRTADLTLHVLDSSFVLNENSKVWLNKYIHLYIGYKTQRTDEMLWYDLGLMEMLSLSYSYTTTDQTLQLSLSDMTVSLDGTKGGQIISGDPTFYAEDNTTYKKAIETVLAEFGDWHMYMVDDIGPYGQELDETQNTIASELSWKRPVTAYEVIKDLVDKHLGYECYFEKDGTFRVKRIPTCENDPIMMTHEQLAPLVIAESNNSVDFSEVHNTTMVLGHSYDEGDYYTHVVTGSGGNYIGIFDSFEDMDALQDGDRFSFIPNHENTGPCTLKVNNMPALPLVVESSLSDQDKDIPKGFIQEGMQIVVEYRRNKYTNQYRFLYLGRTQVQALYMLVSEPRTWNQLQDDMLKYNTQNIKYGVNPDSPLTVDKIGVRPQVLSGGEYDKIYFESDAMDRAQYETWVSTNMAYSLSLDTVLIPWLEVNQKISYQSPLDEMQRIELGLPIDHDSDPQYIIKSISRSLSDGTQTLELARFYKLYPWIIDKDTT